MRAWLHFGCGNLSPACTVCKYIFSLKLKRHGGSLNHPKGNTGEDGGRDDKTNMSRVALSAYTKTTFWAYARASLRPRIPILASVLPVRGN